MRPALARSTVGDAARRSSSRLLGAVELGAADRDGALGGALRGPRWTAGGSCCSTRSALVAAASALAARACAGSPPVLGAGRPRGPRRAAVRRGRSDVAPDGDRPATSSTAALLNRRSALDLRRSAQVTLVVGPALGGAADRASSTSAPVLRAWTRRAACALVAPLRRRWRRSRPRRDAGRRRRRSTGDVDRRGPALRRGRVDALKASFAIDLVAMTFGMPRALFAVARRSPSTTRARRGPGCSTRPSRWARRSRALTTGWIGHARRLGRIVIVAGDRLGPGASPRPGS